MPSPAVANLPFQCSGELSEYCSCLCTSGKAISVTQAYCLSVIWPHMCSTVAHGLSETPQAHCTCWISLAEGVHLPWYFHSLVMSPLLALLSHKAAWSWWGWHGKLRSGTQYSLSWSSVIPLRNWCFLVLLQALCSPTSQHGSSKACWVATIALPKDL